MKPWLLLTVAAIAGSLASGPWAEERAKREWSETTSLRAQYRSHRARRTPETRQEAVFAANATGLRDAREAAVFVYNNISSFSLEQLALSSFQTILDANSALLAPNVVLGVEGVGSYVGRDAVVEYQIIQHPGLNGGGLTTLSRTVLPNSLEWKPPVDRGLGGTIRPGDMELHFRAETIYRVGDDPEEFVAIFNQTVRFAPNSTLIEYLYSVIPGDFSSRLGDAGVADAYEICSVVQVFCGETLSPFRDAHECYKFLKSLPRECAVENGTGSFFAGNTLACRTVHLVLLKLDPVVHCSHVGPDSEPCNGKKNPCSTRLLFKPELTNRFAQFNLAGEGDPDSVYNSTAFRVSSMVLPIILALSLVVIYIALLHWKRSSVDSKSFRDANMSIRSLLSLDLEKDNTVSFNNLSVVAPSGKILISSVSGYFPSGKLIGMMGASGSGKTTLLKVLSGRSDPLVVSGMLNVPDQNDSVSVPQGDAMLQPGLTAFQTVMLYADQLGVSRELGMQCLIMTGLERHLDTRVPDGASGEEGGLSGGQQRRLSVAVALLRRPSTLFCDEITSGLDSTSALALMTVLGQLSRLGMTIVCSIHQPRDAIFFAFDVIFLLVKTPGQTLVCADPDTVIARVRKAGASISGSSSMSMRNLVDDMRRGDKEARERAQIRSQEVQGAADVVLDSIHNVQITEYLLEIDPRFEQERTRVSISAREHGSGFSVLQSNDNDGDASPPPPLSQSSAVQRVKHLFAQMSTYACRFWLSSPFLGRVITILLLTVAGFLQATLFWQLGISFLELTSELIVLFLAFLTVCYLLLLFSARILPPELERVRQERSLLGVGFAPYMVFAFARGTAMAASCAFLFHLVTYFTVGMRYEFSAYIQSAVLFTFSIVVVEASMLCIFVAMPPALALLVSGLWIGANATYSGAIRPIELMPEIWQYTVPWITPLFYGMQGLARIAMGDRAMPCPPDAFIQECFSGDDVLVQRDMARIDPGLAMWILLAFLIFFRFMTWVVLHIQSLNLNVGSRFAGWMSAKKLQHGARAKTMDQRELSLLSVPEEPAVEMPQLPWSLEELAEKIRSSPDRPLVQTRYHRLLPIPRCFIALDLVSHLTKLPMGDSNPLSRAQATAVGQAMMDTGLIAFAQADHGQEFSDDYVFCRWRQDSVPSDKPALVPLNSEMEEEKQPETMNPVSVSQERAVMQRPLEQVAKEAQEFPDAPKIATRYYHLRPYPRCFIASDLVTFLAKHNDISRKQAEALGQAMVDARMIGHVTDPLKRFADGYLFYRWRASDRNLADSLDLMGLGGSGRRKLQREQTLLADFNASSMKL